MLSEKMYNCDVLANEINQLVNRKQEIVLNTV